jgi:hypothetical protein
MSTNEINKKRRVANRKSIGGITVENVTAISKFSAISKIGTLVDASSSGLLLIIDRKDLIPKTLRESLSLDQLLGEHVMMRIAEMNLDIDGYVSRSRHIGKGMFELAIDFSLDAPEYWRECLVDLLPSPGEMSDS